MTYTVTKFLAVLLTTYEWLQYAHLVRSCLQYGNAYENCGQVVEGFYIPQYWTFESWNTTDASEDFYGLSSYNFYGWQRANLTSLKPALLSATAATMLHACNVNSTCRLVYMSTPTADAQVKAMLESNLEKMIALTPESGDYHIVPDEGYANALRFYTNMRDAGSTILNYYNWQAAIVQNYTITNLGYNYGLRLSTVLQGGATRLESLMNMVAFYSYDVSRKQLHGGGKLSYKRRKRSEVWINELPKSIDFNDKVAADEQPVLVKRGCDTSSIDQLALVADAVHMMCNSTTKSFYRLPRGSFPCHSFKSVVKGLENYKYNAVEAAVAATSALCKAAGWKANCFPRSTIFNYDSMHDLNTALGMAVASFSTAAAYTKRVDGMVVAADLGVTAVCAVNRWIHNDLTQAKDCCAKSCYSPKCKAARSGSYYEGPGIPC
ncbi:hypothetical protein V1504DRAFT_465622 [Lipomyces starkeyi]